MWWTRSSGDAGVGMRLLGLSAGWVGTGGWGMRRMDAGVGSFPITDRVLSARSSHSSRTAMAPRRKRIETKKGGFLENTFAPFSSLLA